MQVQQLFWGTRNQNPGLRRNTTEWREGEVNTQHNTRVFVAMSASEILKELNSLKEAKTQIEHKISALEAQLRDINLQNDAAVPNGSSLSYSTNGLTQDMIHRYSRHLMLPSFGVQGLHIMHTILCYRKPNFILINNQGTFIFTACVFPGCNHFILTLFKCSFDLHGLNRHYIWQKSSNLQFYFIFKLFVLLCLCVVYRAGKSVEVINFSGGSWRVGCSCIVVLCSCWCW